MKSVFNIGVAVVIATLFSSCLGTQYVYTYGLEKSDNTLDTGTTVTYEDSAIRVLFSVATSNVLMTMRNKTNNSIKIIWDETLFMQNSTSSKVMHSGIKYNERNNSQVPSVIPTNTFISDVIVPNDNVYWRNGYYSRYGSSPGGWVELPLFPQFDDNNQVTRNRILNSKGSKFKIFMPIQIEGKNKEYTFNFVVTNVKPKSK